MANKISSIENNIIYIYINYFNSIAPKLNWKQINYPLNNYNIQITNNCIKKNNRNFKTINANEVSIITKKIGNIWIVNIADSIDYRKLIPQFLIEFNLNNHKLVNKLNYYRFCYRNISDIFNDTKFEFDLLKSINECKNNDIIIIYSMKILYLAKYMDDENLKVYIQKIIKHNIFLYYYIRNSNGKNINFNCVSYSDSDSNSNSNSNSGSGSGSNSDSNSDSNIVNK